MTAFAWRDSDLRALCPLVLDALDYPYYRLILADLIDFADPDLARRLRLLPTYELALRALGCGRYYEREVATQCRGLVLRYEATVRQARVRNLCNSRTNDPFRQSPDVSTAERCGLPACGCTDSLGHRLRYSLCWCVRRAHCLALVWRGLNGEMVPPDVESGLAPLRAAIRSEVARTVR